MSEERGVWDDLTLVLNLAVLERKESNLVPVLQLPRDFIGLVDVALLDAIPVSRFPVVEEFLQDIGSRWPERVSSRSGIWIETDASGEQRQLEAAAVSIQGRQIVLIEILGARFLERQEIIQRARDDRLSTRRVLDETERASQELRIHRDELESIVRERTNALQESNDHLQREMADRARYQDKLRSLAHRLSRVEEEERRRIARGLHDEIGQALALAKMGLASIDPSGGNADGLDTTRGLLDDVIAYTRSLTFELASPLLYELGLSAALDRLAEETSKNDAVRCRFRDDGVSKPLIEETSVVLYQGVKELIHNALKHAKASLIEVRADRVEGRIELCVVDDGVGFDSSLEGDIPQSPQRDGGFGLFNLRERLAQIGGDLKVDTNSSGTRITLSAALDL